MEDNLSDYLGEEVLVDWLEILDQCNFADKVVDHRSLDIPFEDTQHDPLHLEEVGLHVAFGAKADQFGHLGRVPLFVLSSDEEGGTASQLKDVSLNGLGRKETVQDAGCQNPRVKVEAKLLVNAEQPV